MSATSPESLAALGPHTNEAMDAETGLREMIALLARASDTESGMRAALALVRRVVSAHEVRIEMQWEGAVRHALAERSAKVAPDASAPVLTVPIASAGDPMGTLHVIGPDSLSVDDEAFCQAAASLFAIAASRDLRTRALELEIRAQVRQVAEQQRFIEAIVDALPFGVYVVDRDYRIHAWNRSRETGLQGVSRVDAIGRTIFELFRRQPAAMLKQEFDDVFASGRMQQFQMESTATGATRTFRISKIPMSLEPDVVTHVITVGEDITDWKAALERIAQSEKLAALGQLAAGVMHEINNPLATIAACAESLALQEEGGGGPPTELLRIIDLEVERCKKIVDGLLDFSRPKQASRSNADLNDVVSQALFLLRHHPHYKRVEVSMDLAKAPLPVHANVDQLVQVVIALAMNAFDATPDGKQVVFRTAASIGRDGTACCRLEVADEGPGIPRAIVSRIFEPFFSTKPQGKGTGLGLSICFGIVNDHGGTFELVAPDRPGATFRIDLPHSAVNDVLTGVMK